MIQMARYMTHSTSRPASDFILPVRSLRTRMACTRGRRSVSNVLSAVSRAFGLVIVRDDGVLSRLCFGGGGGAAGVRQR